ncbi:hypothetical protein M8J77_015990 [Diaphorina citri]|nr:hypothetical protein M8J77_015990 [Diaphorina citri]
MRKNGRERPQDKELGRGGEEERKDKGKERHLVSDVSEIVQASVKLYLRGRNGMKELEMKEEEEEEEKKKKRKQKKEKKRKEEDRKKKK